jgi:hypothetical protein
MRAILYTTRIGHRPLASLSASPVVQRQCCPYQ